MSLQPPPVIYVPPTLTPGTPPAAATQPSYSPAAPPVVATPGLAGLAAITVSGTLTTNGTTPLVFPPLYAAGIVNGRMHYSDDGTLARAEITGIFYADSWYLVFNSEFGFNNGNGTSVPLTGWVPLGTETGTPTLQHVQILPPPASVASQPSYSPGAPPAIAAPPVASPGTPPAVAGQFVAGATGVLVSGLSAPDIRLRQCPAGTSIRFSPNGSNESPRPDPESFISWAANVWTFRYDNGVQISQWTASGADGNPPSSGWTKSFGLITGNPSVALGPYVFEPNPVQRDVVIGEPPAPPEVAEKPAYPF